LLFSCQQSNFSKQNSDISKTQSNNKDTILNKQSLIDTSVIAILPIDTANPWVFKNTTPSSLSIEDIQLVDKLLTDCIKAHNIKEDTTKEFSEYIDLKKYKRQYIPFINSKGEKKVYVNCFCISDWVDYWKTSLVEIDDGGSCFFHITINLDAHKYEQLYTNGYA